MTVRKCHKCGRILPPDEMVRHDVDPKNGKSIKVTCMPCDNEHPDRYVV